jgi:thiol-disulfide isomerase/thioredoxin
VALGCRDEAMKSKNIFNIIVVCAVLVAAGTILVLKFASLKDEVIMPKKGELTVVYIGGTLCKPCELLKPVFAKMETDFASHATMIHMLLNNSNKDAYKIDLIPTVMVFDKDAREVTRRIISEEEVPGVPEWIDTELKKLEQLK